MQEIQRFNKVLKSCVLLGDIILLNSLLWGFELVLGSRVYSGNLTSLYQGMLFWIMQLFVQYRLWFVYFVIWFLLFYFPFAFCLFSILNFSALGCSDCFMLLYWSSWFVIVLLFVIFWSFIVKKEEMFAWLYWWAVTRICRNFTIQWQMIQLQATV